MKSKTTLLLFLVVMACSSSGGNETSQDSTAMNDTLNVPATADHVPTEATEDKIATNDTSQLEITFDETAGLVFERQELFYTVSVVTQQYEASSDVTWYFDTEISPLYFKETWASEGGEGSTEFFIQNREVQCAYVEESYGEGGSTEKWCRTTGGTLSRFDVEPKDILPADYGKNYNESLSRYLGILKTILAEAEVTQEDEDSMTLRIEKSMQVGEEEFPGSTEVTIPKKVYEAIK